MSNKIELYICDTDEVYLEKLRIYLITRKNMFNIHTFSNTEQLKNAVNSTKNRIDILAVSYDIYSEEINTMSAAVKVILLDSYANDLSDEYIVVNKFQKTEDIINTILRTFEKNSGQAVHDDVAEVTKIIGVFSPAGGSGKTLLSLLFAKALKNIGLDVFLLNMERICSIPNVSSESASLSNIFLGMKSKGTDMGIVFNENIIKDENSGISMFAAPESYLEWNEIDKEQRKSVITNLYESKKFDVIIIDFESELNSEKLEMLSLCNHIAVPFTDEEHSRRKVELMKNEFNLHSATMSSLVGKMKYIKNKSSSSDLWNAVPLSDEYMSIERCMKDAKIPDIVMNIAKEWSKER